MSTQLTGLILFVNELDQLKKFYLDHFNRQLEEETPGSWVLLTFGPMSLGLHKTWAGFVQDSAETNVKLIFDTSEKLSEKRLLFQSLGLETTEIKTFPGYPYHVFDGKDPEGNVFQVRMKIKVEN
jgi:predicted enzyme related to lactoylglutathione lyase